jgi:hypothetical protein
LLVTPRNVTPPAHSGRLTYSAACKKATPYSSPRHPHELGRLNRSILVTYHSSLKHGRGEPI